MIIFKVMVAVLVIGQVHGDVTKSINLLRRMLFDSYDPKDTPGMPVHVAASLNLLSLNDLDIKEQKLSIAAYFYFKWTDENFAWLFDPAYSNYSDVSSIFCDEDEIWTPSIIIENSIHDIDVISRPNIPVRVNGFGQVDWMPAGIFSTHCESKVTYWPLDTQNCDLMISTWAVTNFEVNLDFSENTMVTSSYQEHGEWELVHTANKSSLAVRESMPFRRLSFTMTFRRRHLFHTLNTLLPVVLFGLLTIVVFKLNPESGERVGLSLTILLAYAVYLSLISESIPQTSLSASLLSTYLAIILMMQTLSVLLTVIYLDVYFTTDDVPVPNWLQSSIMYISYIVCLNKKEKNAKVCPVKEDNHDIISTMDLEQKENSKGNEVPVDEKEIFEHKYSWKEISRILDKITMYIYIIVLFLLTTVISIVMIFHYQNP
ncbi:hypothetical protein ACF0H5_023475 [Mactra antiquata]